jgi:hypothetical protein
MYRCSRSRFHGKETFTRLRPERLASYNIWSASRSKAAKNSKREPSSATELSFRTGGLLPRPGCGYVTQSATAFGISRPTYYQAEADFQRDGLFGLTPEKRGPRQGHKLTPEVLDFAVHLRASDPSSRLLDLAAAIRERFAINAHPRSIELQVDVVGLDLTALIDTRQQSNTAIEAVEVESEG